jgi:hypothetical protein
MIERADVHELQRFALRSSPLIGRAAELRRRLDAKPAGIARYGTQ